MWLNRAGILAEAVAFLLIAPEIISIDRVRSAHTNLEKPLSSLSGRLAKAIRWWREDDPQGWIVALAIAVTWPIWPLFWVVRLGVGLLDVLVQLAAWLLVRPVFVRALVFGTGVLLLFGGMASQFVATF